MFNALLALFTWRLWGATHRLWGATKETADATKIAADAAILAQRPWIKLEVSLADKFENYDRGMRLKIKAKLTNIGNSPALDIQAWAPLTCGGASIPFGPAFNKIPAFREGVGPSLFPKDFIEVDLFGTIVTEEIEVALVESGMADHIIVGLVVDVVYRFAGGRGETQRLFTVDSSALFKRIPLKKIPIDAKDLFLSPVPFRDTAN